MVNKNSKDLASRSSDNIRATAMYKQPLAADPESLGYGLSANRKSANIYSAQASLLLCGDNLLLSAKDSTHSYGWLIG